MKNKRKQYITILLLAYIISSLFRMALGATLDDVIIITIEYIIWLSWTWLVFIYIWILFKHEISVFEDKIDKNK